MKAVVCHQLGPLETLVVEDIPPPVLEPGHVRVRVDAAAVNFPDVLLVAGDYQITLTPPFIPGSEFAGTVVEGDGFAPGDRVAGAIIAGAFAEEIVVPADALWRAPDGVDAAHAAAFGVAHRTAYHVLRSVAQLQTSEDLVVLGAGGGVGLAAVQLGAVLGATVTAVASSPDKLAVAAAHGATHLIDHRRQDLRSTLKELLPRGSSVVVDPVGGDLAEPAYRSLRWGGRFVTVGFASGTIPRLPLNLVLLKGAAVLGFQFVDFLTHAPDEAARNEGELLALLAEGKATPHIGATFDLNHAVDALRLVAEGAAVGKVVVLTARNNSTDVSS